MQTQEIRNIKEINKYTRNSFDQPNKKRLLLRLKLPEILLQHIDPILGDII